MLEQWRELNEKLRSHDAYYGVTGNYRLLSELRRQVAKLWRKWLGRRNRGKPMNWERFIGVLRTFPLAPAGRAVSGTVTGPRRRKRNTG